MAYWIRNPKTLSIVCYVAIMFFCKIFKFAKTSFLSQRGFNRKNISAFDFLGLLKDFWPVLGAVSSVTDLFVFDEEVSCCFPFHVGLQFIFWNALCQLWTVLVGVKAKNFKKGLNNFLI